jgi:hypothetical protein
MFDWRPRVLLWCAPLPLAQFPCAPVYCLQIKENEHVQRENRMLESFLIKASRS